MELSPFTPLAVPVELPDLSRYGPWAVVAGGSEGVGAAFADRLAAAGINLVLLARKPAPLEATATRCRAHGVDVRIAQVDLTADDAIDRVSEVTAGLEIGLLVYNAGADSAATPFLDSDPAHVSRLIALNITAPLALARLFGTPMRARRRGGILLVGSLSGDVGTANHAVYGATKAFSRLFAEGLWAELREEGVDVLELVLGLTRTPAMERVGIRFDTPGLPYSEPEDVAHEGLCFLASGPVRVAGANAEGIPFRWHPDRARVVAATNRAVRRAFAPSGRD